ncbi:MAG TPA: MBL fold metallo-hydrolase [Luteimonas sp.]|nr:MBL fold metallo-hydrolase [Luteimonas sp.]
MGAADRLGAADGDHGIHLVDTQYIRPRFGAAYLVVEHGRGAFIDCGTALSVPHMMAALDAVGLAAQDVDWLIVTHAHLDHAGGAGTLMAQLPVARLVAHPRAAPHLVAPARLIEGTVAVHGAAAFARHYGAVVAVDPARVAIAADGETVDLAGRALLCVDTPGHARHHLCVWDARSRSWFTGDTFGLSYRQFDSDRGAFALPSTSPVQFDPVAAKGSIARLLERDPVAMYVTHFGRVDAPRRMAADLVATLDTMVAHARRLRDAPDRHARLVDALVADVLQRLHVHGAPVDDATALALLGSDLDLNAQGLLAWLDTGAP